MHPKKIKQTCAIMIIAALFTGMAHATDRNADLILGLGFNAGKTDEYDTQFDFSAGAGMDIYLSKNVGLVIGGEFGRTFGGASVTIGATEIESDNDAFNWWQLGGGLKVFI